MKKSIILFSALAMLTQPAGAMTNEAIYKVCKPYVDSGFDIKTTKQATCFGFFVAVAHTTKMVCEHANYLIDKEDLTQPLNAETRGRISALSSFASAHGSSGYDGESYPVDAQVLSFVNWVEKNPNESLSTPMPMTWLQDYPCEIQ